MEDDKCYTCFCERRLHADGEPCQGNCDRTDHAFEETCAACRHGSGDHMSPAIDLGLPMSGDVCQGGNCPCAVYAPAPPQTADVQEAPDEGDAALLDAYAAWVRDGGPWDVSGRPHEDPFAWFASGWRAAAVRRSSEAAAMSPKVAAELAFENERAETWRAGYDEGRADERAVAGEAQARIAAPDLGYAVCTCDSFLGGNPPDPRCPIHGHPPQTTDVREYEYAVVSDDGDDGESTSDPMTLDEARETQARWQGSGLTTTWIERREVGPWERMENADA